MSEPRVTLIVRDTTQRSMDWNHDRAAPISFVESIESLTQAIDTAVEGEGPGVERVVIDRAGRAEDFLNLLAALPFELTGDILLIREDGSGFLSATGRGGDRVLYALAARDVRFYLETHDLVPRDISLRVSKGKAHL